MNSVNLIGFVTNIETPKEGAKFLRFSIAVRKHSSQVSGNDTSFFVNCVTFGKMADAFLRYVQKGHKIGISGRLQVKDWTSSEGVKKTFYSVVVNELSFIGKTIRDNETHQERNDY